MVSAQNGSMLASFCPAGIVIKYHQIHSNTGYFESVVVFCTVVETILGTGVTGAGTGNMLERSGSCSATDLLEVGSFASTKFAEPFWATLYFYAPSTLLPSMSLLISFACFHISACFDCFACVSVRKCGAPKSKQLGLAKNENMPIWNSACSLLCTAFGKFSTSTWMLSGNTGLQSAHTSAWWMNTDVFVTWQLHWPVHKHAAW